MRHPYFGDLDLPDGVDVMWERQSLVAGQPTELWLWGAAKVDGQALDWLATQAQRLDELHAEAQSLLRAHLEEDRSYIDFHTEELGLDAPREVAPFVADLRLTLTGLWSDGMVVLDYNIAPEDSDEILAVKFPRDGNPCVAWES